MSDLISRQAAIDATQGIDRLATLSDNDAVVRMSAVEHVLFNLPSAQPEKRTNERTETHARDCISRQAAIDALDKRFDSIPMEQTTEILLLRKDLRNLPSAQPEIIRCRDCVYYDPPHVDDNGERREYKDMPNEAFDVLGTGLVSVEYGINVGGRCARDYNAMYSEDKRVFVGEDNYCGRAERRTDG